jgi:aminopeptidase N
LPKLDLIAIPDFNAGAMENWGGITYLDSRLLFDPLNSSQRTREDVYEVVAHEMAHQWSGDLVTMAWWDNLWLNEGFASWMQKKSADRFNPTWKVWLRAHESKELAMRLDARATSHPIQQEITEESQADSAFDQITYEKGQAFIRMIEAYLGEDVFRDGIRRYMQAHAYSNATTADLWQALEQASGKEVGRIASGFTEHAGIPLIEVATSCSSGKTVATLRQSRFSIANPYADRRTWQVPVIIGMLGDREPKSILVAERQEAVEFPGCDRPVKANLGGVGYYRVQYDEVAGSALRKSFAQLAAADRVNLLADSWGMVQAGRADVKDYLDLTRELGNEVEYVVWQSVITSLLAIDDLERSSIGREDFRSYARNLLRPVLGRLGWDAKPGEATEDPEALQLRALTIDTLGRFGDAAVIEEARRRFAAFLKDPATLAPDLRDPVTTVVGFWADPETYRRLHDLGRKATGTEELLRYYLALAGAGYPSLITQTIDIAAETNEIPKGQLNRFLVRAASTSDAPLAVWNLVFAEGRRQKILQKVSSDKQTKLLPEVAQATSDPAVAFQLKWAAPSRVSEGARYEAAKAVEEIEFKAELRSRLLPAIDRWLQANR